MLAEIACVKVRESLDCLDCLDCSDRLDYLSCCLSGDDAANEDPSGSNQVEEDRGRETIQNSKKRASEGAESKKKKLMRNGTEDHKGKKYGMKKADGGSGSGTDSDSETPTTDDDAQGIVRAKEASKGRKHNGKNKVGKNGKKKAGKRKK